MSKHTNDQILDVVAFIKTGTPSDPKEHYRHGDLFTMKDHSIVKEAIRKILADDEQLVIQYSFWKDYSTSQIASLTKKSEREVELLHHSALSKIRTFCLTDKSFSRSNARLLSKVA